MRFIATRPIRNIAILSISLLLAACWIDRNTSEGSLETSLKPNAILIDNITTIDGIHGAREQQYVVIAGDKILYSGDDFSLAQTYAEEKETSHIDGTNKYLIPGLWDAHVHLSYTEGLDYRTFFPLSIAHGVTSLRDTGGHLELLAEARADSKNNPLSPSLYVSGPLIDGPNAVYNGETPSFPDIAFSAASPEEGKALVDKLAADGVDFIKAYEMLPSDVFKAVVKRAKYHQLPVAAHVPLSMTVQEAAEAGASDFQHLRNLEFSCSAMSDELWHERMKMLDAVDAPHGGTLRAAIHKSQRAKSVASIDGSACDEVIQSLADNRVFQTPTLAITRFFTRALFKDKEWRETFSLIPAAVGDGWKERSSKLLGYAPSEEEWAYDNWMQSMIVELHNNGVEIIAGTDAPIGFLTPGASLHQELFMLVEAGLSPLETLKAATYTPAAFFGKEDEIGTIRQGMIADLVILNSDPLDNIHAIADIEFVIKSGKVIDRHLMDELKLMPSSIGQ
ncbi:amidohydrolase family protein [Hirschia litorea]|uniref:Amidohydrolase family protein n=1 Tax=Hirschia litorea TaxID=1199156 RepID=A0ABW2II24_9PROT